MGTAYTLRRPSMANGTSTQTSFACRRGGMPVPTTFAPPTFGQTQANRTQRSQGIDCLTTRPRHRAASNEKNNDCALSGDMSVGESHRGCDVPAVPMRAGHLHASNGFLRGASETQRIRARAMSFLQSALRFWSVGLRQCRLSVPCSVSALPNSTRPTAGAAGAVGPVWAALLLRCA
jgi:hypothetical protein